MYKCSSYLSPSIECFRNSFLNKKILIFLSNSSNQCSAVFCDQNECWKLGTGNYLSYSSSANNYANFSCARSIKKILCIVTPPFLSLLKTMLLVFLNQSFRYYVSAVDNFKNPKMTTTNKHVYTEPNQTNKEREVVDSNIVKTDKRCVGRCVVMKPV